jgi:hypothetical protein
MVALRGLALPPKTPKFGQTSSTRFHHDAFNKENDTNGAIIGEISPRNQYCWPFIVHLTYEEQE